MFQNLPATFLLTFVFANIEAFPNTTAQLVSTYAKVAHWGVASPLSNTPNEARARSRIAWSQNQSLKKRPAYTTKIQTSKLDQANLNPIPSKGEVQERFNPRPYFDFTFDELPYRKPNNPKNPVVVYGTPSKPIADSYSSPFNSYNPPEFKPDDMSIVDFPPNVNSSSLKAKPVPKFPENFHPPLSPPQTEGEGMETPEKEPAQEEDHLEEPPDFEYHHHHHHHQVPKLPSMAEEDLSPPPHGKLPPHEYFYNKPEDFYHYPVYHEVKPTTTTTIKPRAGHYSYYYLGRKLWYIPLYFSVYFIIYVTILILKSIARHKIQFSHNFEKARSGRGVDDGYVDHHVLEAVENVNKKFM